MRALLGLLKKAIPPQVKTDVSQVVKRGSELESALNGLIHGGVTGPQALTQVLVAKAALDGLISAIRDLEKSIGVA